MNKKIEEYEMLNEALEEENKILKRSVYNLTLKLEKYKNRKTIKYLDKISNIKNKVKKKVQK